MQAGQHHVACSISQAPAFLLPIFRMKLHNAIESETSLRRYDRGCRPGSPRVWGQHRHRHGHRHRVHHQRGQRAAALSGGAVRALVLHVYASSPLPCEGHECVVRRSFQFIGYWLLVSFNVRKGNPQIPSQQGLSHDTSVLSRNRKNASTNRSFLDFFQWSDSPWSCPRCRSLKRITLTRGQGVVCHPEITQKPRNDRPRIGTGKIILAGWYLARRVMGRAGREARETGNPHPLLQ